MKHEDTIEKAYKEKIDAQLQQAKAKLDGLEATAKERKAQAEINAITTLRAKRMRSRRGPMSSPLPATPRHHRSRRT